METFKKISKTATLIGLTVTIIGFILFYSNVSIPIIIIYLGLWMFFIGLELLAIRILILSTKKKKRKHNNGYIIANIVVVFWAFCGLWGMLIISSMNYLFQNSDSYKVATEYILNSEEYQLRYGEIYGFGFMTAGTITQNNSELTFSVRVEKDNPDAMVNLTKDSEGLWKVETIHLQ